MLKIVISSDLLTSLTSLVMWESYRLKVLYTLFTNSNSLLTQTFTPVAMAVACHSYCSCLRFYTLCIFSFGWILTIFSISAIILAKRVRIIINDYTFLIMFFFNLILSLYDFKQCDREDAKNNLHIPDILTILSMVLFAHLFFK